MKKCPFCAEQIQDQAVKCRYCGEFLVKQEPVKWYFKIHVLIIAFICVGPFALPLVWFNPRFSKEVKIIISVIVLIISYFLGIWLTWAVKIIREYYQLVFDLGA